MDFEIRFRNRCKDDTGYKLVYPSSADVHKGATKNQLYLVLDYVNLMTMFNVL